MAVVVACIGGFNPRPPPERGATSLQTDIVALTVFQSTPPSGERSDGASQTQISTLFGFNPRPPPERGATAHWTRSQGPCRVSIHAPLRREERLGDVHIVVPGDGVSIHAPLRREERLSLSNQPHASLRFQSTPPSGERSDCFVVALSTAR